MKLQDIDESLVQEDRGRIDIGGDNPIAKAIGLYNLGDRVRRFIRNPKQLQIDIRNQALDTTADAIDQVHSNRSSQKPKRKKRKNRHAWLK
jgi:hypothetical protein